MSIQKQTGFTVIETMLFLAITGLMVVAMVAGTSISVNNQRYHDAVRSLKSTLQDQYAELVSTENNRSTSSVCGLDGPTPVETESANTVVGQSDCEIIGRYMLIDKGDISVFSVIGMRSDSPAGTDATTVDDIALMQEPNLYIGIDKSFVEKSEIEWGAEIAWPSVGSEAKTPNMPRAASLLFIRSPNSGQVYTFYSDKVPDEGNPSGSFVQEMITSEGRSEVNLCVNSAGLLDNNNMFIQITSRASSASAVESLTNDHNELAGKEMRC